MLSENSILKYEPDRGYYPKLLGLPLPTTVLQFAQGMAEAKVFPVAGSALSKYTRTLNLSKTEAYELTLQEVLCHDTRKDCWVVIYDRVYDVTDFLDEHPGGSDLLLEYAGRDASVAFRSSGHSNTAILSLEKFFIGELPPHERIFRKKGGFKLSDIPE